MTDYSRDYYRGFYGHLSDYPDSSTIVRMQQQYWATKQAVFKKLGKKEDDCITACDAELDTKLELFQTIEETCSTLMKVLENYQDRLCALAQEENAMGRFLKESGKRDKTRAGKMMSATGKTLSYSAQQRLALRMPLIRLYQEVETFQYRAITDTLQTIEKMEKARTSYRGALMWMKDVSQQLDPDTQKQLEKFRKVQSHVRKSKIRFDKLKLDTQQKIDLLSASRCNMFSHALATYQKILLQFWKKTSQTMTSVAQTFKGYQHFEFSMLKELTEPSKKLAEETSNQEILIPADDDKDAILFFEAEYHDEEDNEKDKTKKQEKLSRLHDSPMKKNSNNKKSSKNKKNKGAKLSEAGKGDADVPLLNLDDDNHAKLDSFLGTSLDLGKLRVQESLQAEKKNPCVTDLLTDNPEVEDYEKDDLTLLNEILNAPSGNFPIVPDSGDSFASEWQAAFGNAPQSPERIVDITAASESDVPSGANNSFLPSHLLEMNSDFKAISMNTEEMCQNTSNHKTGPITQDVEEGKSLPSGGAAKKGKQDMSAWFNLFADLDPLANPDLIGQKKDVYDDRNC